MGEAYILNRNRVSRVKWKKFSCNVDSETTYEETTSGVGTQYGGESLYSTNFTIHAYSDYEFSESSGFTGVDYYGRVPAADAIGYYDVSDEVVHRIDDVEETTSGGTDYLYIYKTTVAKANSYTDTWYEKGSTEYGVVYAAKGKLPEDGEHKNGSATGRYCVLKIDGVYYYYEKIET